MDALAPPRPTDLPAAAAPAAAHQAPKYGFIDALRGYAVLLVITCHTGGMFHNLPYPLKKLTNFGWHGVQLFFLMSCVTLMLSWQSDVARGRTDVVAFWLRRLFRIAPLYYLAGAFYFVIETPPSGFDPVQLATTALFVNAWHPLLIPTTAHRWMVVPGGWSIGVEMTFYAVFPLIAAWAGSLRRAMGFVAAALAVGCVASPWAHAVLAPVYGRDATANFLYFWFPNQLAVFALGTVLFHLLQRAWRDAGGRAVALLQRHANAIVPFCGAACVVAANLPFPERLPLALPLIVPTFLVASAIFMLFALTLGVAPGCVFNAAPMRALGKVSFSAYLIHFAVLHKLPLWLPGVFSQVATGWRSIGACAALWLVAVPLTFGLSWLTYRAVELPMIALGRRVIEARRHRLAAGLPTAA